MLPQYLPIKIQAYSTVLNIKVSQINQVSTIFLYILLTPVIMRKTMMLSCQY